jgi:hypothetical protein
MGRLQTVLVYLAYFLYAVFLLALVVAVTSAVTSDAFAIPGCSGGAPKTGCVLPKTGCLGGPMGSCDAPCVPVVGGSGPAPPCTGCTRNQKDKCQC